MPAKLEVYAVVRIDQLHSNEDAIAITAILPTMEEAVSEVARLNGLNKDKGAHYFWRTTRYFPKGKGTARDSLPVALMASAGMKVSIEGYANRIPACLLEQPFATR